MGREFKRKERLRDEVVFGSEAAVEVEAFLSGDGVD